MVSPLLFWKATLAWEPPLATPEICAESSQPLFVPLWSINIYKPWIYRWNMTVFSLSLFGVEKKQNRKWDAEVKEPKWPLRILLLLHPLDIQQRRWWEEPSLAGGGKESVWWIYLEEVCWALFLFPGRRRRRNSFFPRGREKPARLVFTILLMSRNDFFSPPKGRERSCVFGTWLDFFLLCCFPLFPSNTHIHVCNHPSRDVWDRY